LATLSTTLAPQIDTLMSRAEHLVEIERARISSMEETVRILQKGPSTSSASALNTNTNTNTKNVSSEGEDEWSDKLAGLDMGGMGVGQRRKVTILRNKRDRMMKAFADAGLVVPTREEE
jgi:DASH complex subunit SPC19